MRVPCASACCVATAVALVFGNARCTAHRGTLLQYRVAPQELANRMAATYGRVDFLYMNAGVPGAHLPALHGWLGL